MLSRNVTVCIFAWNEEARILRCIDNFSRTFPLIVVDNFSTDRTVEIANSANCRCIQIKNPGFVHTPEVMDPLARAVTTDYILIASVSEFAPMALQKIYAEVVNADSHDVVAVYRESITAGEPIRLGSFPRSNFLGEPFLFRKGSIDFAGTKVHGCGTITAHKDRVLTVVGDPSLYSFHFRDYDCSKTETTLCRYDDVLAKQRFESGVRFSLLLAALYTLKSFMSSYLRNGCLRFGMLGFLHSYYRAHMEFSIWLRVWELENGHTLEDVKQKNDAVRRKLEETFQAALELEVNRDGVRQ